MTNTPLLRTALTILAIVMLTACSGTKVVKQWHSGASPTTPSKKLAVIAMMPEEGMRHLVENKIAEQINLAGGSAVSSTSIPGMRGKLTREKAVAALEEAGADGVLVIFITGLRKGEELERADYHVDHVGTATTYNWLSPQFVEVYTITEGEGFYEQERTLVLETTYLDYPSVDARWIIVTESSNMEYRDTSNLLAAKVITQMKKDGTL